MCRSRCGAETRELVAEREMRLTRILRAAETRFQSRRAAFGQAWCIWS